MNSGWKIALFLTGILFQAFFAGSETAFIYVSMHEASAGVKKWKSNMKTLLSTTLVGVNLSMVLSSTIAAGYFIGLLGKQRGGFVSIIVVSLIVLAFGEIIPKSIALRHSHLFSSFAALPLRFFSIIFFPAIFIFNNIASPLAMFIGLYFPQKQKLSPEDILILSTSDNDDYSEPKRDLLQEIFQFEKLRLHDVMTPTTRLPALSGEETTSVAREIMGDSNIAVISSEKHRFRGFVLRYGKLSQLEDNAPIKTAIKAEPVLPITQTAGIAISNLARYDTEVALVADESGNIEGVVSLASLFEHFGEKEVKTDDTSKEFILDSEMLIRDFQERIGQSIPSSRHYQTIGGMIIEKLGRIPQAGESIKKGNWSFTVLSSTKRKIDKIKAQRIES